MLVIKVMSTIPCPCGGLISIVRFNRMGRFGLRLLNQKNKQTSKNKDQPEKKKNEWSFETTNPVVIFLFAHIFALHPYV